VTLLLHMRNLLRTLFVLWECLSLCLDAVSDKIVRISVFVGLEMNKLFYSFNRHYLDQLRSKNFYLKDFLSNKFQISYSNPKTSLHSSHNHLDLHSKLTLVCVSIVNLEALLHQLVQLRIVANSSNETQKKGETKLTIHLTVNIFCH